ncbi:MAG: EAL domain-containing protein [Halioglobus sp.]|nr:EAL domain-containing protein [Halioglobus sp.]
MAGANGNMLALVELVDQPAMRGLEKSYSDEVLHAAFEARMQDWIRPRDECHKLPDKRMCVVLSGMHSAGEVKLAAAKLERVFLEPHDHMGKTVDMRVKVGFAAYSGNGKTLSTTIQNAAEALGKAKSSSRMFEIYSAANTTRNNDQGHLLARITDALDRSEFQLYYQPKVNAAYNTLQGAEALIRWHNDDGEVIPTGEFIELAEQHDLIKPLSWWVIKSAVSHLSHWPEAMTVAVNISPVLLLDRDIISVVLDALDLYGVAAQRLTLEVTETLAIADQDHILKTLAELRSHRVRIAIDDFGTGFSSLAYFRDLPADEIKIDQCFVRDMLVSKKDYAIVKAVIDLAHSFSLKVVAEGVESVEIADKLAALKCDVLQGYVYDAPLPIEEFEAAYKLR